MPKPSKCEVVNQLITKFKKPLAAIAEDLNVGRVALYQAGEGKHSREMRSLLAKTLGKLPSSLWGKKEQYIADDDILFRHLEEDAEYRFLLLYTIKSGGDMSSLINNGMVKDGKLTEDGRVFVSDLIVKSDMINFV
ncbi:hypothetical protein [Beggiatoa leptomitoformis]|uniref:Uncharacterized protein n=1 Tax=Beggiatoa leptomitoformis TaxID=288004 RepID=A0A2N9YH15_9GAMM|nr:hypothetical protein [Beggiatoa leptomitoformis]ALG67885.1 hypothetical protein AL038_09395 [Beggiatoa leptomitoformis]AUI69851.1 hypothetical protein BLE401_14905 [Beggiatoa leptomitoformis]